MFDLMVPEVSYMIGLFQTDGHLTSDSRNRGRLVIELKERDSKVLEKIAELLPCNYGIYRRERKTNFSDKLYSSVSLKIYDRNFREWVSKYVPIGKKSNIISIPKEGFSEIDYWRGVVDGDGSLGITSKGKGWPFLSLITCREKLASEFCTFIYSFTGKRKTFSRNCRDNVFNICITKEDTQLVVKNLYYKECLCIERKGISSKSVLDWVRPVNMRKVVAISLM